jgi:DNA gyrase/topoisomerase IV subunit A
MCDGFLTLAKTPSQETPSCFLVPRYCPDGTRNTGFRIMRLKDKLADRANASSEIEYHNAWAMMVGEEGKGVKTISITDKTGPLLAIKTVADEDDLMIITVNGIAIRMNVSDLRVMGRATQGVRLIKLNSNDAIASVTRITREEEVEEIPTESTEKPEGEVESQD